MPKLAEAAAIVAGSIIHTEPSFEYGTQKQDGVRCILNTGEGFASVKLNLERANEVRPVVGQNVAWLLRYGATGGKERDAAAYSTFVRPATSEDVAKLNAFVTQQGKGAQQEKAA